MSTTLAMKSAKADGRLQLLDGAGDLRRHVGEQRDRLAGALAQLMRARGELGRIDLAFADLLNLSDEEGITVQELQHLEAPRAAHDHMMAAVRRRDVAQDLGDACRRG